MKIVPASPEGIAEAVDALRADEVVAYPTETVYGLAVNPFSDRALARLFETKGRTRDKAVLLIVADDQQLRQVVAGVSARAEYYVQRFWPGPLTLLFERSPRLPDAVTSGSPRVAVRCPGCETAQHLCRAFGGALTSTSANASGMRAARSVGEIGLCGVAVAIDGGVLPESAPSTLLDPDTGEVLREGAVPLDALRYPDEPHH